LIQGRQDDRRTLRLIAGVVEKPLSIAIELLFTGSIEFFHRIEREGTPFGGPQVFPLVPARKWRIAGKK
jgi:hypothetical protein